MEQRGKMEQQVNKSIQGAGHSRGGQTKKDRAILIGCCTCMGINGMLALSMGSLLPYIKSSCELNYTVAGLLLTLFSLGNLITSYVAGILPVYITRRMTAVIFAGCGIVCFLLIAFGQVSAAFIAAFLLAGLSRGNTTNVTNTGVSSTFPGSASKLNLLHASFSIGAFVCPFMVMLLAAHFDNGWRIASVILMILMVIQFAVYSKMEMPDNRPARAKNGRTDWGFLKLKRYYLAVGILFFYMAVEQCVNGWLITYFQDSGFMTASYSQGMESILWLFVLGGRLFCVYLSGPKMVRKERLLQVFGLGFVVFYGILMAMTSLVPITVCVMAFGFCMAGLYPTTVSTISDIMKDYPISFPLLLLVVGISAMAFPEIVGKIADVSGIAAGMGVLTIAAVITAILIFVHAWVIRKEKV